MNDRTLCRAHSDAASSVSVEEVSSQADTAEPELDIQSFIDAASSLLQDIEDFRLTAASWCVKIIDHKYTKDVREDIMNFVAKATMAYSSFEGHVHDENREYLTQQLMASRQRCGCKSGP